MKTAQMAKFTMGGGNNALNLVKLTKASANICR